MPEKKSIRFYTTSVAVSKTVADITKLLVSRGAQRVATLYGTDGVANGLSFVLPTEFGDREYALPARVEGVYEAIKKDMSITKSQRTPEKAARIAWRIAFGWLDMQFALIDAEMSSVEEIMLPYMVSNDGTTFFEIVRQRQLAIEN